ncbi:MAG: hypothetical protein Q8S26_17060 [Azonexus sp.]|nr:hypothetical protein [Azonexus sp.]
MIKNAAVLLRGYTVWARQLPQATGMMFAARSPLGRSVKIGLFGIGVVLPLGSLIWAVLFWHGNGVRKAGAAVLIDDAKLTIPAPAGDI